MNVFEAFDVVEEQLGVFIDNELEELDNSIDSFVNEIYDKGDELPVIVRKARENGLQVDIPEEGVCIISATVSAGSIYARFWDQLRTDLDNAEAYRYLTTSDFREVYEMIKDRLRRDAEALGWWSMDKYEFDYDYDTETYSVSFRIDV